MPTPSPSHSLSPPRPPTIAQIARFLSSERAVVLLCFGRIDPQLWQLPSLTHIALITSDGSLRVLESHNYAEDAPAELAAFAAASENDASQALGYLLSALDNRAKEALRERTFRALAYYNYKNLESLPLQLWCVVPISINPCRPASPPRARALSPRMDAHTLFSPTPTIAPP